MQPHQSTKRIAYSGKRSSGSSSQKNSFVRKLAKKLNSVKKTLSASKGKSTSAGPSASGTPPELSSPTDATSQSPVSPKALALPFNTCVSPNRTESKICDCKSRSQPKVLTAPRRDIRICLSVSNKMSLQVPTMHTIFDALPTEINVKIVRGFLSSPDAYRRALSFANVSEQHRREVIEAFSNKISANLGNLDSVPDMIALFGKDLHELSITYGQHVLANIPPIPSLRTADIRATKESLRIIKGASSLTKLHVQLDYGTCWKSFIKILASLPILYLGISGRDAPPPPVELRKHLYQACSNIKEIVLDIYNGQSEHYECYWPLILRLKYLKRISFTNLLTLEDEHLMFLRGLEIVELRWSPKALQQAVRIGHNVTEIGQDVCVAEENVVQLSCCPNLKSIGISLEEGAERALIGKIDNVLEMELRWGDRDPTGAIKLPYYEPDGELLLELVNRAPNLKRVGFQSAVVRMKHIRRILKTLGPRLVYFVVDVNNQGEGEAWRMTQIWKSLATWCPNIERVTFFTCSIDKMNEAEIIFGSVRRKCPRLNVQVKFVPLHS